MFKVKTIFLFSVFLFGYLECVCQNKITCEDKVSYSISRVKKEVLGGKLSKITFNLHHVPDSTNLDVGDLSNILIMINGAQPSIFYSEKVIQYRVEPTDSLRVLIRPFQHYYFDINNLFITQENDYIIDIWFCVFPDIFLDEKLRYVKPLRLDSLSNLKK